MRRTDSLTAGTGRLLLLTLLLVACSSSAAQQPAPPPPTNPPASPVPTSPAAAASNPVAPTVAAAYPAPDPTPVPPTPTPAPPPTTTPVADELAYLAAHRPQTKNRVLLARALTDNSAAPEVARTTPLDVQVGHTREFWVNSITNNSNYPVVAELRYAGPVVLMYVEQGLNVDQAALEESARTFEQEIYPRTRALFGSEWQPGVDGDNRIVVLNLANLNGGVIGYFSPRDSLPASVNRFSNEHEMFYMNVGTLQPGTRAYLDTLSHEFQHMIHWHEQRQTSTWFNEGNSTLSQDLNGFVSNHYIMAYLNRTDTQLNSWGELPAASIAHYGASHLFMRYIYVHYAREQGLQPLIRANAGNYLDAFVQLARQRRSDLDSFSDLFAEWTVANLLNDPTIEQGQYAYAPHTLSFTALPNPVAPASLPMGTTRDTVQQFGVDYYRLPPEARTLTFSGTTAVPLVGAMPQDGHAWWSNRGDNSLSTLTHAFDLRGLERATLQVDLWYEIELGYDYAFVAVSTDGGTRWFTLAGSHTTDDDPHGANYGNGLTGVSGRPGESTSIAERGQWVTETFDLSPYTGQEVLVRFWQVTDEGFNAPGLLLDTIRIPELGFVDEVATGSGAWQADGFVRVDGDLPQQWAVRLVRTAPDGSVSIIPLRPDASGQVRVTLAGGGSNTLVVAATTPYTSEPAAYRVVVE